MANLPGLCLGQKKNGRGGKKGHGKSKERKLEFALTLPLGCFLPSSWKKGMTYAASGELIVA
eukprot:4650574-Amphidinium_carterae.7